MSLDTQVAPVPDAAGTPVFNAPYAPPDEQVAASLMAQASRPGEAERRIDAYATRLIEGIRARAGGLGGIEDFLHAYSLSTKEGLALMVLAEALLRVPDAVTADRLIEDKLATGDWSSHEVRSSALLVTASAWTLGVTARIIHPGETPENILESLVKRLGLPAVRTATRQAMRLLGSHFVLGQTIEEALRRAGRHPDLRYSFDMLGEGARTAADAGRYFAAYAHAIDEIGAGAGDAALPGRPGISVKLSALHPRFEAISRARVLDELVPHVIELARKARHHELNFTVDAEEADRLELTLDVLGAALADPSLRGWEGFGLAVQAYQKRAPAVIDWLEATAHALGRRLTVRLVKGAYWDTEVKRTQERGLADYPVFTRKAMTDLCYTACTRKLLAARPRLYPQFATHNALTVAGVIEDAGGVEGYEFQRLHGMGEVLYELLLDDHPGAACRVYAPVGGHRDLLAYLVRRLLENGANSSFVSVAADPSVPIATILERPQHWIADARHARHPKIPLPRDLYAPERRNSSGVEFGDRASLEALLTEIRRAEAPTEAAPLIDGIARAGKESTLRSPIDGAPIGRVREGDDALASAAMAAADAGFPVWAATPIGERAAALERASDLLRGAPRPVDRAAAVRRRQDPRRRGRGGARGGRFLPLLRGAGAPCARAAADAGPDRRIERAALPRPRRVRLHQPVEFPARDLPRAGERGARRRQQRGRQAGRADAADRRRGRAHPARGRRPGGRAAAAARRRQGRRGAHRRPARRRASPSPARPRSARVINRALAAKDGPIVPLIAETGGINAMIVDATALPEQVTDDVVASAFRSAGQRCSALRLLCVQEDVADPHRRDDRRRGARAQARRSARFRDPCRAGDRRRGQGQARPLDRSHGSSGPRALSLGPVQAAARGRHLRAAGDRHARPRP